MKDVAGVARIAATEDQLFAFMSAHPDLCRLFAAGRLIYTVVALGPVFIFILVQRDFLVALLNDGGHPKKQSRP